MSLPRISSSRSHSWSRNGIVTIHPVLPNHFCLMWPIASFFPNTTFSFLHLIATLTIRKESESRTGLNSNRPVCKFIRLSSWVKCEIHSFLSMEMRIYWVIVEVLPRLLTSPLKKRKAFKGWASTTIKMTLRGERRAWSSHLHKDSAHLKPKKSNLLLMALSSQQPQSKDSLEIKHHNFYNSDPRVSVQREQKHTSEKAWWKASRVVVAIRGLHLQMALMSMKKRWLNYYSIINSALAPKSRQWRTVMNLKYCQ